MTLTTAAAVHAPFRAAAAVAASFDPFAVAGVVAAATADAVLRDRVGTVPDVPDLVRRGSMGPQKHEHCARALAVVAAATLTGGLAAAVA